MKEGVEYLLDRDPLNRAMNTFELREGTIVIRRYWDSDDVAAILKANHYKANHAPAQKGDLRQAASIPDMVIYEWLSKFGVRAWDKNHQKKINELLSSNEYYRLRTGGGRL
jgi:hypothetical protein